METSEKVRDWGPQQKKVAGQEEVTVPTELGVKVIRYGGAEGRAEGWPHNQ